MRAHLYFPCLPGSYRLRLYRRNCHNNNNNNHNNNNNNNFFLGGDKFEEQRFAHDGVQGGSQSGNW